MTLDITSLSQLGRLESEFEVVKGLKIKLHTLSVDEQQEALKAIPNSLADPTAQFHAIQKALLIAATELVNDEKITKDELIILYSKLQEHVFQSVAERYTSLLTDANSVLQGLQKDFPKAASL